MTPAPTACPLSRSGRIVSNQLGLQGGVAMEWLLGAVILAASALLVVVLRRPVEDTPARPRARSRRARWDGSSTGGGTTSDAGDGCERKDGGWFDGGGD